MIEICIQQGVFPLLVFMLDRVLIFLHKFSSLYFSSNLRGYFPLYRTLRLCGICVSCFHSISPFNEVFYYI